SRCADRAGLGRLRATPCRAPRSRAPIVPPSRRSPWRAPPEAGREAASGRRLAPRRRREHVSPRACRTVICGTQRPARRRALKKTDVSKISPHLDGPRWLSRLAIVTTYYDSRLPTHVRLRRLRDCVRADVRVLLVGINPGIRSAAIGHHFAGYSNRFWKLLYESRIVPEPVSTEDDHRLPAWGFGVT